MLEQARQGYQRFGNDQTMLKEIRDPEQARFHSPRRYSPPLVPSGLNLNLRGGSRVETSLGSGMSNLFAVRFEFPDTSLNAIPELLVARHALPSSLSAFHGVIGRDVLRRWEYFRYEGRRQRLIIRHKPHPLLRCLTG